MCAQRAARFVAPPPSGKRCESAAARAATSGLSTCCSVPDSRRMLGSLSSTKTICRAWNRVACSWADSWPRWSRARPGGEAAGQHAGITCRTAVPRAPSAKHIRAFSRRTKCAALHASRACWLPSLLWGGDSPTADAGRSRPAAVQRSRSMQSSVGSPGQHDRSIAWSTRSGPHSRKHARM